MAGRRSLLISWEANYKTDEGFGGTKKREKGDGALYFRGLCSNIFFRKGVKV